MSPVERAAGLEKKTPGLGCGVCVCVCVCVCECMYVGGMIINPG